MRRIGRSRSPAVLLLPLLACGDTGPTEPLPRIPTETNPSTDRAVLSLFYETTNGTSWENSTNWLSDAPLDHWYGVDVDTAGRVTGLQVWGNDLRGSIPLEIGHLSMLRELHLGGNGLTGRIPPEIGRLSELRELNLRLNDLEGPIPRQVGNLSRLRSLHLGDNELTGRIPPEIGRLLELRSLTLSSNDLEGPIPPGIGRLADLRVLHLGDNELTGRIPSEFGGLRKLWRLGLSSNDLEGPIPSQLGDLADLERLWLQGNDLEGRIPPEIGRLSRLTELHLSGNELTGRIPPEIGGLSTLQSLWLEHNRLEGPIPPEIGRLARLSELHLGHNALTGRVPPEIGRSSQLQRLSLEDNDLDGPIPSELGGLSALTELALERNVLSGHIPASLGNLTLLERLSLALNDLTGPVPAELSGLVSLRVLTVNGNPQLSGLLPAGFKDLARLTTLNAGGTALCAPADPDFLAWLGTLENPRVRRCEDDVPPVYLTQAVQSFEFPAPLVANVPALLRVFLTAPDGEAIGFPPVRARFYLEEAEVHKVDIPASAVTIPSQVSEGRLDASANAAIPAEVVQPGLELVVEVDPEDTLGPEPGITKRIPAAGRHAIDVRAAPALHLTYLPVVRLGRESAEFLSRVRDLTEADALFRGARAWLPVADFTLALRDAVYTSARTGVQLIREIDAIRVMEGGTGYYMGGLPQYLLGELGVAGQAWLGGRTSIARLSPITIAHELGHNMSLDHAPCGGASGPDPGFPTRDGTIGAWGFNPSDSSLVAPEASDLMSYCGPKWISEYSFTKAFDHRLREEEPAAAETAGSARSILLWGGINADGVPFLEPSFVAPAPPVLPRSGGAYTLTGMTIGGEKLFSLNFDMQEVADGDGESGFAFALPVSARWADGLARIVLSAPGGTATLDDASGPPAALLRDPRTGRVRGILRGLTSVGGGLGTLAGVAADPVSIASALPDEAHLEVLISRGLPAVEQWRRR